MSLFSDPTWISVLSSLFSGVLLSFLTFISRLINRKIKDDRYKAVKLSIGNMVANQKTTYDKELEKACLAIFKKFEDSKKKTAE